MGRRNETFHWGRGMCTCRTAGVCATNLPLVNYIFFAYKVQPNRGPALLKQLPTGHGRRCMTLKRK